MEELRLRWQGELLRKTKHPAPLASERAEAKDYVPLVTCSFWRGAN
jgi:hypothetical protein